MTVEFMNMFTIFIIKSLLIIVVIKSYLLLVLIRSRLLYDYLYLRVETFNLGFMSHKKISMALLWRHIHYFSRNQQ